MSALNLTFNQSPESNCATEQPTEKKAPASMLLQQTSGEEIANKPASEAIKPSLKAQAKLARQFANGMDKVSKSKPELVAEINKLGFDIEIKANVVFTKPTSTSEFSTLLYKRTEHLQSANATNGKNEKREGPTKSAFEKLNTDPSLLSYSAPLVAWGQQQQQPTRD